MAGTATVVGVQAAARIPVGVPPTAKRVVGASAAAPACLAVAGTATVVGVQAAARIPVGKWPSTIEWE